MWPTLTLLATLLVGCYAPAPFQHRSHIGLIKPNDFSIEHQEFELRQVKKNVQTCSGVNYYQDEPIGAMAGEIKDDEGDLHGGHHGISPLGITAGFLGTTPLGANRLKMTLNLYSKYGGHFVVMVTDRAYPGTTCLAKNFGRGFKPKPKGVHGGFSHLGYGGNLGALGAIAGGGYGGYGYGRHLGGGYGGGYGKYGGYGRGLAFGHGAYGKLGGVGGLAAGPYAYGGGALHGAGSHFGPLQHRFVGHKKVKRQPQGVLTDVELVGEQPTKISVYLRDITDMKQLGGRGMMLCPQEYVKEGYDGKATCKADPEMCCPIVYDNTPRKLDVYDGQIRIVEDDSNKDDAYPEHH